MSTPHKTPSRKRARSSSPSCDLTGAYRSTHPDVLAKWDAHQALYDEYNAAVRAFRDAYPGFDPLERQTGGFRIVGLRNRSGDASPGPGWRHQKTTDGWVPDRRSKVGQANEDRLREMRVPDLALPGMPHEIVIPGHWYSPGMLRRDDEVFVRWAAEPAFHVENQKTFDGRMWERIPLSVFYAAHEANVAEAAS